MERAGRGQCLAAGAAAFVSLVLSPPVPLGARTSQEPSTLSADAATDGLQQPSFRSSSTELVVLPVIVNDHPDQFVSDLKQEQFAVYDNGRRMPIQFFTNEDTPVTVGLVIDASSSMRRKVGEVIAAAMAFAESSNPEDELFTLYFNDDVHLALPGQPFLLASDTGRLLRALTALVPEGRTSLYDALIGGLDHLALGTRSRKVLVVVSDGGDNASRATLDEVLARARSSNAAIYTIGIYDEEDPDRNPGALKTLASATGGERYLPRSASPLLQACRHIAREIRSGYTIGYVPPDRDGAFHRVRVEVEGDRRKLKVRTRPGYFASRDSSNQQGREQP